MDRGAGRRRPGRLSFGRGGEGAAADGRPGHRGRAEGRPRLRRSGSAPSSGYINAVDPPAGEGLPADQELRKATVVQPGQLLFQIDPREFQAQLDQCERGAGAGQGGAGEDPARRRALHAAGQRRARSASRSSTTRCRPTRPTRRRWIPPRRRSSRPQLNLGWTKVTSPIDGIAGHRHRPDRRSGRADDRADHRFAGRSDQGRSSRSASRSTCAGAHAHPRGGRSSAARRLARADPRRRQRLSAPRHGQRRRPRGRPAHRHHHPRGAVPEPRATSCDPAATPRCGPTIETLPNALVDPAARGAGPAGHVRRWRWSARTTRSRCAPSTLGAAHRHRLGGSRRAARPANAWSSRACRRCAAASRSNPKPYVAAAPRRRRRPPAEPRRGRRRMSQFFINRPIVAMVISIIMVIVGVVAMVQLPIAQFPEHRPAGDPAVRRPTSAPTR